MNMGGQPPFVIALLVAVPVLVLVIVALLVYVCCHRRYKLNWYERSLLDSGATDDHTTSSHLLGASASSGANSNVGTLFSTGSTTTGNHGSFNATPVLVPQTVVEYVTVRGKMGSYPSSPLSSPTSEHSSGEWEERSKDTFSFPLPSPGSTLSPWGYKTMEIDNGLGSNPDSRLEPKRNSLTSQSTCKSDISAYVPVQPFRRFSAGATPGGESRQTPSGIFPIPNTDDKNTTPQNRKKRSNSLIPQLAMPLTNYLKSGHLMRVGSSVKSDNFTAYDTPITHTQHCPVTRINALCGHHVPRCTCTASPQAIPSGRVGPIAPGQDPNFDKQHADTHRGMWWTGGPTRN